MGDVKQFPDIRAEYRELMVQGLRTMADALEQGIDDYDALLVVPYHSPSHDIEPFSFNLSNPELSWIGSQLVNWAIVDHSESYDDDD